MTESKKKEKGKAKCVYVPPRVELHIAEPSQLMGATLYNSDHAQGFDNTGESNHQRGTLNDVLEIMTGSNGAKEMILGQEFGFSDVWEE